TQGLGKTGPRRDHVTLGLSIMPLMGMTHLWSPYRSPRPVGAQASHPDNVTATLSALAVLAALRHRDATGEGQHIDVAQAEAAGLLLGIQYLECTMNGRMPEPLGNVNPYAVPWGVYPCAEEPGRGERWCAIAVTTPAQWRGLCHAMGDPPWCQEPRFADLLGRRRHRKELDALLSGWTRQHTPHEVMGLLQAEGVPAGAVQNGADLYHDPHLRQRGFILEAQPPGMPTIAYAGVTMRLSGTPAEVRQRAPALGEHNDYVYGELLGLSAAERRTLAAEGVLA
ncbi:MAG: CoA transferase, partial [Chloroflexi bacterium]|nr:CoA transferase [Chloroflexota bacterium]